MNFSKATFSDFDVIIFIAEDFALKSKFTHLISVVKSSKIITGLNEALYIPVVSSV